MKDSTVFKYSAAIKKLAFTTSEWGCVTVYFVVPEEVCGVPYVIYYIHGAG
ncbi:hypothetical protein [Cellulosilyticum ruminicola]|uniref:hypothetical protein n=1 Tax=Cellulosilyticum ruminicola TaxID=425254 RepID=UPI001FA78599|nr:hypothetical protein [Cellulosilyticum ruminicola]